MKIVLAAVGAAAALVWLTPDDAEARGRGWRKPAPQVYYRSSYRPYYGRPASVGPNGLCQRDTGTPTGSLDFRNKCDTEEFWNRTMNGGRRR